ncbi:MAG: SPOR domain-containing protein, partial [Pseudomonadota bacterium]|nr:SPOR domain-containing protein [Pseudomonadota bacterium]
IIALLAVNAAFIGYFVFSGVMDEPELTMPSQTPVLTPDSTEQSSAEPSASSEPPISAENSGSNSAAPTEPEANTPTVTEEASEDSFDFYHRLTQDQEANIDNVERLPLREAFSNKSASNPASAAQTAPVPASKPVKPISTPPSAGGLNLEDPTAQAQPSNVSAQPSSQKEASNVASQTLHPEPEASPLNQPFKFDLQAGSFRKADDAKRHAEHLVSMGFDAYFYAADINGHTWHRVIIGPFADQGALERTRAELSTLNIDSLLVPHRKNR